MGESAAGHLSPIIAVYEAIKKTSQKSPSQEVEFMLISSQSHFLREVFEDTGIAYKVIITPKFYSSPSAIQIISGIPLYIIGFFQSLIHVFNYMPDVIFSKGGYVSLPVVVAGWMFQIPIIIHESDAIPAFIDKLISRFAKRIAISFEQNKEFYSAKKIFFTGNPTREFISEGDRKKGMKDFVLNEEKPTVLILGGSEGAEKINELVLNILSDLLGKYQIIHQCGIGNYDKIRTVVEKMNIPNLNDYHIFPFFKKRIADAYAACDLIISRAGANTVSEIMIVGKPSVLIPLSESISDEQTKNAFYYSEAGAAILLSEKNLKPHLLLSVIDDIFKNRLKMLEIQKSARSLAQPLAAQKIADEVVKIAR